MRQRKLETTGSRISSLALLCAGLFLLAALATAHVISPVATLVIFCASIIVLLSLLKPEYAMYVFCMLPTLGGAVAVLLGAGLIIRIACFGAAVLLFSWWIAKLSGNLEYSAGIPERHSFYYIAFFGWASLSLLWSYDKTYGIVDLVVLFLALSTFYISASVLAKKKTMYTVVQLIIFIGFVSGLLSLIFPYSTFYINIKGNITEKISYAVMFWDHHWSRTQYGRTEGLTTTHQTAAFLIVPIALSMMLFFVTVRKRSRTVFFLLAVIMLGGMIATLSKMPVFSVFAGVGYVMFHIKSLRRRYFANMLKFLILVVILFCLVRIQNVGESFSTTLMSLNLVQSQKKVTSVGSRLDIMKVGLPELWRTKGFGCGIGGFRSFALGSGLSIDAGHQMVLYELGCAGLLLWLWLLISGYRLFVGTLRSTTDEYYRRILLIYTGGYISLMATWIFTLNYGSIFLWFYMGIGYALVRMSERCPMREAPLPFHESGESIVEI